MTPLDRRVRRVVDQAAVGGTDDAWAQHVSALRELDKAHPIRPKTEARPKRKAGPKAQAPPAERKPPRPPPPVHDTHEIPEHMQIRPVRWRLRGPEDDYDDGVVDGTDGQALTEYDPFAEFDAEWDDMYGRRAAARTGRRG